MAMLEYIGKTVSAAQTRAWGELLGRLVPAGMVIVLQGDLAAGKTQFVQGLAKGLGISPAEVQSPTFALLHIYNGRLPLYHFDWYRIEDTAEIEQLGFVEYIDAGDGIVAVEWGERFSEWLPAEALRLTFTRGDEADERRIAFSCVADSPAAQALAEFITLVEQQAAPNES